MIKINLMPHFSRTQPQRDTSLRRQLAIGISVVFLTVVVCWIWGSSLLQQRDLLRQEKISKEHVLATVIAKIQEDEQRKKNHNLWVSQAHILPGYGERKYEPIQALDEISRSLEPIGIWLSALSIDRHDISIEGNALSREDVGQFIGNLEASSMFGQLIRMETQPHQLHGENIQQFTIQFTIQS